MLLICVHHVGHAYNIHDRCVAAGYDNGDIKLFDLRAMSLRWETNVKNGVSWCREWGQLVSRMGSVNVKNGVSSLVILLYMLCQSHCDIVMSYIDISSIDRCSNLFTCEKIDICFQYDSVIIWKSVFFWATF